MVRQFFRQSESCPKRIIIPTSFTLAWEFATNPDKIAVSTDFASGDAGSDHVTKKENEDDEDEMTCPLTGHHVQSKLRWGCDLELADRICNYNRNKSAEPAGYFRRKTSFLADARERIEQDGKMYFYDSDTGRPLFVAPQGRTVEQFLEESRLFGWLSFRDEEVLWDSVECAPKGGLISVDGTHLGHNIPDEKGSRYCVNLVSVAGYPRL